MVKISQGAPPFESDHLTPLAFRGLERSESAVLRVDSQLPTSQWISALEGSERMRHPWPLGSLTEGRHDSGYVINVVVLARDLRSLVLHLQV